MVKIILVALLVWSICPSSAFAYFRCDRADGTHYFADSHCKLGEKETEQDRDGNKVYKNGTQPQIGMTKNEVLELPWPWGKPTNINTTETVHGVQEQWIYDGGYRHDYLNFANGILTSIQKN